MPAKGSEAPGRMPEALLTAAPTASLESCRPAKPAFRLRGKLPQTELRRMVLAVFWPVAVNFPRSAGIGWARPGPCLARDGQSGPPPGRAYRDVLVACPGRAYPIPVRALWREKSLESCRPVTPAFRGQGPLVCCRGKSVVRRDLSGWRDQVRI